MSTLSTPKRFAGISICTSMLCDTNYRSAVAPAVTGMYMQANQSMLKINGLAQYLPSGESYNLIFLTATVKLYTSDKESA